MINSVVAELATHPSWTDPCSMFSVLPSKKKKANLYRVKPSCLFDYRHSQKVLNDILGSVASLSTINK